MKAPLTIKAKRLLGIEQEMTRIKASKKGAYDLNGKWWDEEEIKVFTNGCVFMCFGKQKEDIKVIKKVG